MTTTKLIYLIGTVMPFGVLLLAAYALYKAAQRQMRSKAQPT